MAHLHTDLLAIAQLGHHHLLHGALEQARIIWEGLYALAPREAAFALGLGVVRDRQGDKAAADELYARAAQLDPGDPRAEVNRAELALERGDLATARAHLAAAAAKAQARGDDLLETKTRALSARTSALLASSGALRASRAPQPPREPEPSREAPASRGSLQLQPARAQREHLRAPRPR